MNRHDIIVIFDVTDANPNGDPDAGGRPRSDSETGHGCVTDVCLKRKIRNFVLQEKESASGYGIYSVADDALNTLHRKAYAAIDETPVPSARPTDAQQAAKLIDFMCKEFYDIRTFGAVMSTEVNCGQVRGPVQFTFSRSVDPVVIIEHSITRNSVAREEDLGKERTMGRKYTIPYGVYRAQVSISPYLAKKSGFDGKDLELLFEAMENMFEVDFSAARPPGSMVVRGIYDFEHTASARGDCFSHEIAASVSVARKPGVKVPRAFSDYAVTIDMENIPSTVTLNKRVGKPENKTKEAVTDVPEPSREP